MGSLSIAKSSRIDLGWSSEKHTILALFRSPWLQQFNIQNTYAAQISDGKLAIYSVSCIAINTARSATGRT